MKKVISAYGDLVLAAVGVVLVYGLLRWFLVEGPLCEFVARFIA